MAPLTIVTKPSTTLAATLSNAIAFLTRPLVPIYAPNVLIKLQFELESSLFEYYAASWIPSDPMSGSGRRCLTLSPDCMPPRPIYSACRAACVTWSQWISVLGGAEFDFFVDPGCVSVRISTGQVIAIWSDEVVARAKAQALAVEHRKLMESRKTLQEQLYEDDMQEDQVLFTLIDEELKAPTWLTPIIDAFPPIPHPPKRSGSPSSAVSTHSRCSSFSSGSSASGASLSSAGTIGSSPESSPDGSRRERARLTSVFVDTEKKDVTDYDNGKVGVLGGGVMLGAKAVTPKSVKRSSTSSVLSWRSGSRA